MDFLGDVMTFYEKVKLLMDENNVNAKTLTRDLHISKNSVTYWKKNGNIPKGEIINLLADYFNCSVDYLLGKTDIKKEQATDEQQPVSDTMKRIIENVHNLSPENQEIVARLVEQLVEE